MQKKYPKTPKDKQYTKKMNTDSCHVCNERIMLQAASWQEDDDGIIYCQQCWDEKESCGCGD